MKKRIVTIFLTVCLIMIAFVSFSGCTPREEILRIYNWGDYMSKETYKGFEKWYADNNPGKKVKVKYSTFEENEDVYREIKDTGADYDLICPSDYMLERMIKENLVLEFNEKTKEVVQDSIYPLLKDLIDETYEEDFNFLDYGMPYIWGTMGIMYNSKVESHNAEVMSSWKILFENSFGNNKVYMKESVRDSYSIASLYINNERLNDAISQYGQGSDQHRAVLKDIFAETDPDVIDLAGEKLIAQKSKVLSYDIDTAKNDMLVDTNGSKQTFGMFWSCDAGFVMSGVDEEGSGCSGGGVNSNKNLRYIIPDEGSNVWFDNFAIGKNAVNVDAANQFIQYLCDPDIAYDCMDYAGGTSAIDTVAEAYLDDLKEDGFFDKTPEGFEEMFLTFMLPDEEILNRCAIMRDFGIDNMRLLEDMWEIVSTS